MIRAFFAKTIALVVSCKPRALTRTDKSVYPRHAANGLAYWPIPAAMALGLVVAMAILSFVGLKDSEAPKVALDQPRSAPMHPKVLDVPLTPPLTVRDQRRLILTSTVPPAPRPLEVTTTRPFSRPPTPEQIVRGAAVPLPPQSLRNASDLSCIAVAIYHEARDQSDLGQRAVASVILQRAAVPHRWGNTACDNVVPRQFSFMTTRYDFPPITDMKAWSKAVQFAAHALIDGPMPELKGADHYHTTAVSPSWAPDMVKVRSIEDHIFYVDPGSSFSL
ncbi:cell wall hydrolase [Paracoccus sp. (in: a-proteobacteria)]|uniref:cell wall hydrolase n=1 Tax=Paracoccus sp. TaxID=267 RepID=UPI00396D02BD